MKEVLVTVSLDWLQGMMAACMSTKTKVFEAAVVKKGDKNVLSSEMKGNKIVPKLPNVDNFENEKRESLRKALEAGFSPVWRDESGNFCRFEEDADGYPEFYIENTSWKKLVEVAKQTGVPVKEGLNSDGLILKLKKHFGFRVEEDDSDDNSSFGDDQTESKSGEGDSSGNDSGQDVNQTTSSD